MIIFCASWVLMTSDEALGTKAVDNHREFGNGNARRPRGHPNHRRSGGAGVSHVLLGSVVATVAIVGARAADLPAKTALPAEYEKICQVAGMVGFVLPGSDTCVKISGFATGQIEAGNLKTGYLWTTQGVALSSTPTDQRPAFGYTAREFLTWDARQDTPYGTLRGLFLLKIENGNGFDNTGTAAYLNLGYVQWEGELTVGKAPSFFAFYGGGISLRRRSLHRTSRRQTSLICSLTRRHSAQGFSATAAAQSAGSNGASGAGTNVNINTTNLGGAPPDAVANIRVDQSWGSAQLSGVAHQVHVDPIGAEGPSLNTWGWAVNGGASIKFPQLGAADQFSMQASYTKNAIWYSGILNGMWGEDGAVNGNGLPMSVADAYYAGAVAGVAHSAKYGRGLLAPLSNIASRRFSRLAPKHPTPN